MRFLPQGPRDVEGMLETIGISSIAGLFECVPESLRLKRELDTPAAQSEIELRQRLGELASRNAAATTHPMFLGAGAYNHYIPAAVSQLLLRSEFYTSYTPYQPEISQGTLQTIFEYQSLIAALTEMDISNASLYDGASALAEGLMMAHRTLRRPGLLLSAGLHPHYSRVVRTYVRNLGLQVETIPIGPDGRTDPSKLRAALRGGDVSALAVQSPNFLGCVENLEVLVPLARESGALFEAVINEPISLGLLHGPGHFGADVALGEAHALGTPLSFGGPFLGFIATKESLTRQMPGRLVGEAHDGQGRRGYVLTLATREQHIRRQKATSNICTNEGLIALAATIYMSLMGKEGLREAAHQCHCKAIWARDRLSRIRRCRPRFDAPIFNEFVLDLPADSAGVNRELMKRGIIGGLPLGPHFDDMRNSMLICVTELNTREEIEELARALEEIL